MVFVTGGTGMLGAHLLLHLAKDGKKIRALKRGNSSTAQTEQLFTISKHTKLYQNIQWINTDIADFNEACRALHGANQVYHCAATVSFNPKEKEQLIQNNAQVTADLVNAALHVGIGKFCHVSSVAALGEPTNGIYVDEAAKTIDQKKASGYAISKSRAEFEVWRGVAEGLNAVIVNPSVIIGAGNWEQGSPAMFGRVAQGFKYYTQGVTGFVDVHDVCQCMIQLMNSNISGERFVLNSENLTYQHIFGLIAKALQVAAPTVRATAGITALACKLEKIRAAVTGKAPQITKETARAAHSQSYFLAQKITDKLDFQFKPIAQSVQEVAELYRKGYKFHE